MIGVIGFFFFELEFFLFWGIFLGEIWGVIMDFFFNNLDIRYVWFYWFILYSIFLIDWENMGMNIDF